MTQISSLIDAASTHRLAADLAAEALSSQATAVLDDPQWPPITIEKLVGRVMLKNGLSVKSADAGTGVRCLTLSSLRNGKIDCSESKAVPLSEAEARPYLVQPSDVFIVRGNGAKHLVGRAGLVETAEPGTIFPDLLIRVPLNDGPVLPEFFVAAWNSPRSRSAIEEAAKTTSGIWKINQGHIAAMTIPVPPVAEQKRLLAHLTQATAQLDQLRSVRTKVAAELDALLPSILDRAFNGDL
jgi:type I restriction enzyme S subunit